MRFPFVFDLDPVTVPHLDLLDGVVEDGLASLGRVHRTDLGPIFPGPGQDLFDGLFRVATLFRIRFGGPDTARLDWARDVEARDDLARVFTIRIVDRVEHLLEKAYMKEAAEFASAN